MKHLKLDSIINLVDNALTDNELTVTKNHLIECKKCYLKYEKIKNDLSTDPKIKHLLEQLLLYPTKKCLNDEVVASYIDNGLPKKEKRKAEKHINTCFYCSEKIKTLKYDLKEAEKYERKRILK